MMSRSIFNEIFKYKTLDMVSFIKIKKNELGQFPKKYFVSFHAEKIS
jgi:hypothetical protein